MTLPAFGLEARPGRIWRWTLPWLIFLTCIFLYLTTAAKRHRENPDDKVVPSLTQLQQGFANAVLKPAADEDDGSFANQSVWVRVTHGMLWKDTAASFRRFLISLLLLIPAILIGLHIGLFPYIGAFLSRFVLFFDKIIALSLLPILFIAFGIDELSKIMLMVIGVAPTLILDTINLSRAVPREQIVKAFTLGARDTDVAYRIVLRQIMPRILHSVRLNLKPLMLFLFAGEMIASTDGLAYRIALARRNMGMDTIIPYVLWVALLLYVADASLRYVNHKLHPWWQEEA